MKGPIDFSLQFLTERHGRSQDFASGANVQDGIHIPKPEITRFSLIFLTGPNSENDFLR